MREYALAHLEEFLTLSDGNAGGSDSFLAEQWPDIVAGRSPSSYHSASIAIDDMIGSAFAREDVHRWKQLLDHRLRHNVAMLPRSFVPGPSAYVADLVAAMTTRNASLATLIARRTLDIHQFLNPVFASTLVAQILALFTGGNAERVHDRATYLRQQCELKAYDRVDSERYMAWADASVAICERDTNIQSSSLQRLTELRSQWLAKQMKRWRKDEPTDISAADLWDGETSALVSVMLAVGMPGVKSTPYIDVTWLTLESV